MSALSRLLGASLALTLIATAGKARFVKGNETVTRLADGSTRGQTPPQPTATLGEPCPARTPAWTPRGWRMVKNRKRPSSLHKNRRPTGNMPTFNVRHAEEAAIVEGQDKRPVDAVSVPDARALVREYECLASLGHSVIEVP